MMDSDGLMSNLLVVLHGLPIFSGARFIESLAAKWTDQLVDRHSNAVSEPVRQYVGERGIPRIWAALPPGEAHWRVLFSELYMRLRDMRLMENRGGDRLPLAQVEIAQTELLSMAEAAAVDLGALPIGAALDWLEQLVRVWATTYDRSALRHQLPPSSESWRDDQLIYYPIMILSALIEP